MVVGFTTTYTSNAYHPQTFVSFKNICPLLFIKTVLDWNHLDDNTVNQSSLESFKAALQISY
jgi:hypothetical protein